MSKEIEKKKSNKKHSTNKNEVDIKKKATNKDKNENLKEVTNSKETKATKEERIIEAEFDYNEDLDDISEDEFDDDEEVVIETVKDESKSNKKDAVKEETVRIEKVPSKKKIEKIEKIAKEKKKKNTAKFNSNKFVDFFEKYQLAIYSFIGGILLATLVAFIVWPERIATLKNGEQSIVKVNGENYTADELYKDMKDVYSVSLLLDKIDNDILTELYPEDDDLLNEVEDNAKYYYNMYNQYYNYTQEQFLEQNGFEDHEDFVEYLKLDYRRNKYMEDYIKKSLKDEEIEKYYDKNVFGDINTQHILVEVSESEDGMDDEEAKELAEKIITKLNDGTSWEDVQKKYKDKITFEDLGYQSWNASLEDSFMDALKAMDDESYSEEPVKTSYGYHIIYRLDQKKKPKLKEAKEEIVEILVANKQKEDTNILYKSLISLREEKKIKFNDTDMKAKYKEYCENYEK